MRGLFGAGAAHAFEALRLPVATIGIALGAGLGGGLQKQDDRLFGHQALVILRLTLHQIDPFVALGKVARAAVGFALGQRGGKNAAGALGILGKRWNGIGVIGSNRLALADISTVAGEGIGGLGLGRGA